ncbi:hypothetical protein [Streptomyces sp. URMC 124]|uniref:hypothetical protein n=1 Tax=Streptomyces sp. URMC 124 TaxID=3423405 RepID=UPI003F1AE74A
MDRADEQDDVHAGVRVNRIGPADRRRRLSWWLLDCTARYTAVFVVAWAVASATAPRVADPSSTDFSVVLPFWESFGIWLSAGPGTFAMVGLPSLCLLLVISGRRESMEPGEFRLLASGLLSIPLLVFLFFGFGWVLLIMPTAHLLFTCWLMPLPFRGGTDERH